ncbi:MAG: NAD(P)(+) transhydrogenase (Re/Si-specific) subunit beta, partial [Oscillospiraceae bacterium]|nr:NAD(P)(+) transhydrogenase (Re/Si-specific) subunit beta [Oscillospiraceae bacterium]
MAVTLSSTAYYIITAVMVLGVLIGISMMSKVKTARYGNALSALCSIIAILVTMNQNEVLTAPVIWIAIAIGAVLSLICAAKVKMIQMPQVVAFLNGLGGLSSALVAILSVIQANDPTSKYIAVLALVIGFVTFTGSMVAAGKLAKLLNQRPVVWKGHTPIVVVTLIATVAAGIAGVELDSTVLYIVTALLASFFGVAFAIRVGGADMPITISLLNSLSGVAGGIAGIAVQDLMLVAVGGIVGASGLLLTQVMCRAMNRKLSGILFGAAAKPTKSGAAPAPKSSAPKASAAPKAAKAPAAPKAADPGEILTNAKKVMIVPGYGMALAQAQAQVKQLADKLEARGCEVKFAIHPVAGRMPGHMNVLLCEVDVPYDQLYE